MARSDIFLKNHKARFILLPVLALALTACVNKRSVYENTDDAIVTENIKQAYMADPEVKTLPLKVVTQHGIVELEGSVETQAEMVKAVHIAEQTAGVLLVKNDITIGGNGAILDKIMSWLGMSGDAPPPASVAASSAPTTAAPSPAPVSVIVAPPEQMPQEPMLMPSGQNP